MSLAFPVRSTSLPTTDADLAPIFADPGFGVHFSDRMAQATWTEAAGWHDDEIADFGTFPVSPADAVLHYAQEIFEGLKAYRHADDSVWLFRPERNAHRFALSAERLGLPVLPEEDFLTSVRELVRADQRWVPPVGGGETSLYLRPFMFAHEAFLGVRPAETVRYVVIASPVGPYFSTGVAPVDIWVTTTHSRAGNGGTGAAKCSGNYASSLIAQKEAYEHGCSQVLFTDAATHSWLEELGGMNVFIVTADGRLVTPPTSGTILDGVTRSAILQLAGELGLEPEERPIELEELLAQIVTGDVTEAFACGTAAVITPIRLFRTAQDDVVLTEPAGKVTLALREYLVDVQYGRREDTHDWLQRVV